MSSPAVAPKAKIAVIYYSMYGHIASLAKSIIKGLESAEVEYKVFQFAETLPKEVLEKMHAPAKDDKIPVVTSDDLTNFDGFVFGFPTRYGNPAAQFKSFWDSTGGLWGKQALAGKPYSIFTSTGTQGGGQEATILTSLSNFTHHGMIYVPIGYTSPLLFNTDEVHGGSPWGAGTFAGPTGARQPSKLELDVAEHQGKWLGGIAAALKKGRQ